MGLYPGLFEDDNDDHALSAAINTTPLVDVMLVLLIIFLITIPVVTHAIAVALPNEINQPTQTRPDNIVIAIDRAGNIFWNDVPVPDRAVLLAQLKARSTDQPQPEVHIRADKDVEYQFVGRVIVDCQRAGIGKIAFITQPERGTAASRKE
jgi:biopolymer transport protein ExbD